MTSECYASNCPYHGCHQDPEEGPFCYEEECRALCQTCGGQGAVTGRWHDGSADDQRCPDCDGVGYVYPQWQVSFTGIDGLRRAQKYPTAVEVKQAAEFVIERGGWLVTIGPADD